MKWLALTGCDWGGPALLLALGLGLREEVYACILFCFVFFSESIWLVSGRLRQAYPQLTTASPPGAALVVALSRPVSFPSQHMAPLSEVPVAGPHICGATEPMFSQQKQLLRMTLFNCLVFVCFALIGSWWVWGGQRAIVFGIPSPDHSSQ